MQDFRNIEDSGRFDVGDGERRGLHRDDPATLSEALHIPTLTGEKRQEGAPAPTKDDPAPLSEALNIPTLINENADARTKPESSISRFHANKPLPWLGIDSVAKNGARATTPAGPPRADAASLIGVPSNHPQTALSGRLATLDKVAIGVAAFMTISPLFAAMIGRLAF